jgi:hypothetical protein
MQGRRQMDGRWCPQKLAFLHTLEGGAGVAANRTRGGGGGGDLVGPGEREYDRS